MTISVEWNLMKFYWLEATSSIPNIILEHVWTTILVWGSEMRKWMQIHLIKSTKILEHSKKMFTYKWTVDQCFRKSFKVEWGLSVI